MTEPKLLTEAEARKLRNLTRDEYVAELRERGLIAPEPIDPLLEEAEALHQDWIARKHKDAIAMLIAAIKRGREIEREAASPLTRDDCKSALIVAGYCATPNGINRLHAALTKQVQP